MRSGTQLHIIVPAALAALVVAIGANALADSSDTTNKIQNDLPVALTDGKVINRQDIKIKSDPPSTVAAGTTGEFKVGQGDSVKDVHLKVQYKYDLGKGAGTETVEFGVRDESGGYSCFIDTPPDVAGHVSNCNPPDNSAQVYKFEPK